MRQIPYDPAAYDLLHNGAIALAEAECNGMPVDVPYVHAAVDRATRKIKRIQEAMEQTDVVRTWRQTYRSKTNLGSDEQLGNVLFNVMGFPSPGLTEGSTDSKKRHKTDEQSLETVEHPFVFDYLRVKKLQKAIGTNFKSILREVINGRVHCFFNLHKVATFRSSSDKFNFQNIPIRDPYIGNLVRKSFVASPGRQLAEIDFKGAEVVVAACYHKDPTMITYLLDKSKDMHRDAAMACFMLPESEITKDIRFWGKSGFVFPEFYGDWYVSCAHALWRESKNLVTKSGVPLRDHLASKGITEAGDRDPKSEPAPNTMESVVKKYEKHFWYKQFPVYTAWKKRWYEDYLKRGWFQMLSGFVCQGYLERNQVINYPVQGASFHCLLQVFTRLVRRELKKQNMKTMVVGQIHDSIIADVVPEELHEYLAICHRLITVKLPQVYPWLIVPMEVEFEVCPVGGSWADKKPYKME